MNNNQNRCGCGGQPTVMDIDRETKENTNFRKEAWTGEHLQITLMCIPTNCDIGAEIHEDTDQLVCIVQGCATISFGATKCSMCDGQRANGGDACLIPAGTWHNITNSGNIPLIFRIRSAAPRGRNSPAHQDLRLLKIK